jgi:hypothetical protein
VHALIALSLAASSLAACGGGAVTPPNQPSSPCAQSSASSTTAPASATRRTSDETPWYPSASPDPSQQYATTGSRPADASDTDAIGAGAGGRQAVSDLCNKPASSGRSKDGIVMIPTQCWFQAIQPGVHDPKVDTFLGCDYAMYDDGFNYIGFAGLKGGMIGVHVGPPMPGVTCNGSPSQVGEYITDGSGHSGTVTDINPLFNGNLVEGWMYITDTGFRFVQWNYNNKAGVSAGIGYGKLGGAVGTPGGYSGYYLWNGMLPAGTNVKRCFKDGATLV